MEMEPHGGKCCAMRHLHGFASHPSRNTAFTTTTKELSPGGYWDSRETPGKTISFKERFELLMKDIRERQTGLYFKNRGGGLCVEVVLTERQIEDSVYVAKRIKDGESWPDILKAHGFRLVSRFANSNTGAMINVFHSHPNFNDEVPDWWKDK